MSPFLHRLLDPILGRAPATGLATLPADDVPWEVLPLPRRIVAVGDVQGDLKTLATVLLDRGLIDESGHWCGGDATLVLNGDLVSGAGDSRLVLNLAMRLEAEARRSGGSVHSVLGNHEILLVASRRAIRRADHAHFRDYPVAGAPGDKVRHAFHPGTAYGRWIAGRNAILKAGDTLFVHAGLGDWAAEHHPLRVNATVRAWIRYWQGLGEKPPKDTRWTVGKESMSRNSRLACGPMWTRAFKVTRKAGKRPDQGPDADELARTLDRYGVRRMVIGHAPTPDARVWLVHPYYGDRVALIDTRMSSDEGRPACLELTERGATPHYADKTPAAKAVWKAEKQRLESGAAPGGVAPSAWARFRDWLSRIE